MKTGANHVIIKTEKLTVDKRGSIFIDTSINPDQHYVMKGKVVAVPIGMSRNMFLPVTKYAPPFPTGMQGFPEFEIETDEDEFNANGLVKAFYNEERTRHYSYADIVPEVEIGDLIYFNWMSIANKSNLMKQENGFYFWKIRYENIFASVRSGKIIPIGSYCFLEPDMETWEEIMRPTFYPKELTGGKLTPRPQKEWILIKPEPQARELKGFIKHVGTPLKGDGAYVKKGDHVVFKKRSKLNVTIEGTKYFAIRQKNLIAFA